MIYSRNNLNVVGASSEDPIEKSLHGVLFEGDGGTVGSDGEVILAVGPAEVEHLHMPDLGDKAGVGDEGVFLDRGLVEKAEKQMPKDKRLSLQHCGLTKCTEDPSMIEFSALSPDGKIHRVAGRPSDTRTSDWKDALQLVKRSMNTQITVSMKSLTKLVSVLEKVAGKDKDGILPVEIEIGTKGMMIRTVCLDTGQTVIGAVGSVDADSLDENEWERGVFKQDVTPRRGKKLRRLRRGS